MQEDILFQISNKLKEIRKNKGVTLQEIANEAGVTKSLVSQIENSRTIPSLPVMLGLIQALDIDLNAFFRDIISKAPGDNVLIRKKEDYQPFTKENAKGFFSINSNLIFQVANTGNCKKQMPITFSVELCNFAIFCCICKTFSLRSISLISTNCLMYIMTAITIINK